MKLASSKGISLKAAWAQVKRGGAGRKARKASRSSSPRTRRRRTMAKGKKNGGHRRKSKFPLVRTGAKIGLAVDGLRRIFDSKDKIVFWATHPQQAVKDPRAFVADMTQTAIGVAELTIAPKLLDTAYSAAPLGPVKQIEVAGHKVL